MMNMTTNNISTTEPHSFELRQRSHGDERWTETREFLDAEWAPLLDEKRRQVHGYAVITETPGEMVGRDLISYYHDRKIGDLKPGFRLRINLPFSVAIIATRDGSAFGAIPRSTGHDTRELALVYARKAL